MYIILGLIIGELINFLIIRPIERKRYRKICIKEGLVSKAESEDKE